MRALFKRSGQKLFQSANGSHPTRQTGHGELSKREGQHHLVAARPLDQGASASESWRSSLAFTFVADPLARLRSLYSWWCTNEGDVDAPLDLAVAVSSSQRLPLCSVWQDVDAASLDMATAAVAVIGPFVTPCAARMALVEAP